MYWFYSITFLFLILLVTLPLEEKIKFYFFLFAFFIVGSGNYYNGVDWVNYIYTYSSFYKNDFNQLAMLFEPGYLGLTYIFSRFFEDMHIMYIFNTFLWCIVFYIVRPKLKELNVNLVVFLFVVYITMGNFLFSGAIRQSIACMFIFYLFVNIKSVSFFRWNFLIILSSLFHFSSLILLPFYFVLRKNIRDLRVGWFCTIYIIAFIAFLLIPTYYHLLENIPIVGSKIANSIARGAKINIGVTIIIDIISIVFLLLVRKRIDNSYSVYWYCSLIYFAMHSIFMTFPYAQRINLYLFPMMIVFMVSYINKNNLIGFFSITIITINIAIAFKDFNNKYFEYPFYNPWFYYYSPNVDNFEIENRAYQTCLLIDKYDDRFCRKFMVLGL